MPVTKAMGTMLFCVFSLMKALDWAEILSSMAGVVPCVEVFRISFNCSWSGSIYVYIARTLLHPPSFLLVYRVGTFTETLPHLSCFLETFLYA